MKPTAQQVLGCQDEQQLNEWAAIWCMGWREELNDVLHSADWINSDGMVEIAKWEYNPCQDKAQAFDLMVNYRFDLKNLEGGAIAILEGGSGIPFLFGHISILPKLLTKTAILSAIGEEG